MHGTHAAAQPRLEAEAQRTLEGVGCNTPCPPGQSPRQKQGHILIESTQATRAREQTLPTAGAYHPALPHGARARLRPTRVAVTPMSRLFGGGDRACSPKEPPVSHLRNRHRIRSAQGEARPCAGRHQVHPHAAGGDLGAHAMMACLPDGAAPPLGRAFGPSPADLDALAAWCVDRGLQTAAMASTGVSWSPLCEPREARGLHGAAQRPGDHTWARTSKRRPRLSGEPNLAERGVAESVVSSRGGPRGAPAPLAPPRPPAAASCPPCPA
jgi:hypothetical protein